MRDRRESRESGLNYENIFGDG